MVVSVFAAGNVPPPSCPQGHPMARVSRDTGFRPVCVKCLSAAIDGAAARSAVVTVNDYLAGLGAGRRASLGKRDADAVQTIHEAAQELFGEADAGACRKVVRDIATRRGVQSTEVMGWAVTKLAGALRELAAACG